jgi:hypothetical protein
VPRPPCQPPRARAPAPPPHGAPPPPPPRLPGPLRSLRACPPIPAVRLPPGPDRFRFIDPFAVGGRRSASPTSGRCGPRPARRVRPLQRGRLGCRSGGMLYFVAMCRTVLQHVVLCCSAVGCAAGVAARAGERGPRMDGLGSNGQHSPSPTSAPRMRSPLPHLRRDWAHRCHICNGTGLAAAYILEGADNGRPHPTPRCGCDRCRSSSRTSPRGHLARSSSRSAFGCKPSQHYNYINIYMNT